MTAALLLLALAPVVQQAQTQPQPSTTTQQDDEVYDLGEVLVAAPTPRGVALGLFAGKQIGIFGSIWLAVRAGIATRPGGALRFSPLPDSGAGSSPSSRVSWVAGAGPVCQDRRPTACAWVRAATSPWPQVGPAAGDEAALPRPLRLGPSGEQPAPRMVRFRTLGCYPLTGAVESDARTLPEVIQEMLLTTTSERQGRMIDHDQSASMEKKKQEGYF